MKFVLKTRSKIREAFVGRPEYSTLKASDFLKLTTTPKLYASIKKSIDGGYFDNFDIKEAGQLQLSIDKAGKVLGHEGRHRAMAAIAQQGPDVLIKVNTYLQGGGSMESIPEFKGQYDPAVTVDLSEFDYDSGPMQVDDVLDLGNWGEEFSSVEEFLKWCNSRYDTFSNNFEITKQEFCERINQYYKFFNTQGGRAKVEVAADKITIRQEMPEPFYVARIRS